MSAGVSSPQESAGFNPGVSLAQPAGHLRRSDRAPWWISPQIVTPSTVHDSCHQTKAPGEAGRAAGSGQAWAASPGGSQMLGGWVGETGEGWSGPASASAELPFRASSQLVRALPLFCPEGHRESEGQDHPKPRLTRGTGCIWPLPALGPTGMHHGGLHPVRAPHRLGVGLQDQRRPYKLPLITAPAQGPGATSLLMPSVPPSSQAHRRPGAPLSPLGEGGALCLG